MRLRPVRRNTDRTLTATLEIIPMPQLTHHNTTEPFSMADTWGNAQVTVNSDRVITVQISGRHYATDAQLYTDRAFVRLSILDAHRLGEAIIAATAAASDRPDMRQTCLWSDATTTIRAAISRPHGWRFA
jgi:hypothetical protein